MVEVRRVRSKLYASSWREARSVHVVHGEKTGESIKWRGDVPARSASLCARSHSGSASISSLPSTSPWLLVSSEYPSSSLNGGVPKPLWNLPACSLTKGEPLLGGPESDSITIGRRILYTTMQCCWQTEASNGKRDQLGPNELIATVSSLPKEKCAELRARNTSDGNDNPSHKSRL